MNDIDISILVPAFFAGVLILLTHIPLGMKVLARGIIFADLAVAQIAGLGVIIAGLAGYTDNSLVVRPQHRRHVLAAQAPRRGYLGHYGHRHGLFHRSCRSHRPS